MSILFKPGFATSQVTLFIIIQHSRMFALHSPQPVSILHSKTEVFNNLKVVLGLTTTLLNADVAVLVVDASGGEFF